LCEALLAKWYERVKPFGARGAGWDKKMK